MPYKNCGNCKHIRVMSITTHRTAIISCPINTSKKDVYGPGVCEQFEDKYERRNEDA